MKWQIILGLQLLIFLPSLVFSEDTPPDRFPVVSYSTLDTRDFNRLLISAEKRKEEWTSTPLSIALRFHKVSDVRFISIKQRNDRAECPLNSAVTIVEEGFLDDQLRGRRTQFHLERKGCKKPWMIREVRDSFLCGMPGFNEEFLKDLCPEGTATPIDVSVEMTPENTQVPCDGFPYTFGVKFSITSHVPQKVTFQRVRSDGAKAPAEEIVFPEAGTKEFEDYYRVGAPGDYWFRVEVLKPKKAAGEASSKITCDKIR